MFCYLNNYLTIIDTFPFPEAATFVKSIEIFAIDNTVNRICINRKL